MERHGKSHGILHQGLRSTGTPGKKHCVNLLFSPDAEWRAFTLNEEQGAGGGWMYGGGYRGSEAKRRDVTVPGGMESDTVQNNKTFP